MTVVWKSLALNPYGEQVLENEAGQRRVVTVDGVREQSQVPPYRVCRATSPEAARLAMAAMGQARISASFGHDPMRAYQVWTTPAGKSTFRQARPAPSSASWVSFQQGVERALGDATVRAWIGDRWGAPGLPKWARGCNAPSSTATRGLQIGLSGRVQRFTAQTGIILEVGLVECGDAATRVLPVARQRLRALRRGSDPRAPDFDQVTQWMVPATAAEEQRHTWDLLRTMGLERTDFQSAIVWVTAASVVAYGGVEPLARWWRHFSHGGMGWVIFSPDQAAQEAELHTWVTRNQGTARVWQLMEGHADRGHVWEFGLDASLPSGVHRTRLAWNTWAPEPSRTVLAQDRQVDEDEFGRVPYRAQSQVGAVEGMAPRRLEASMHIALAALVRRRGSVDLQVSQALGVGIQDLADRLSPEQVDAVAAALEALDGQHGFVVADETGFGKGRILAALALIAQRRGRRLLFVTENAPLFSDFYRDLLAVSDGAVALPFLLHGDARLRNPDGEQVARSPTAGALAKFLGAPADDQSPATILTTYAQISRKQSEIKREWLEQWLDGQGWVLMDEAHNAAGNSQANAHLELLLKAAGGALYASATFAKTEANLGLYAAALPSDAFARRLIRRTLAGDQGLLRETLTQAMARDGRLMRREHPPMEPPETVWVPMTASREATLAAFSDFWRHLGNAVDEARPLTPEGQGVWAKLGAPLSRTVREFGMWMKVEALIEAMTLAIQAGEKPVVATDSTMEAALRDALTPTPEVDPEEAEAEVETEEDQVAKAPVKRAPLKREGAGAPPQWRDRLRRLIEVAVPPNVAQNLPARHPAIQALKEHLQQAHDALDRLPSWTLSPIDAVRDGLAERGFRCGELSGRNYRLEVTKAGWRLADRGDGDRALQVRAFNSGDLDALIISRAGSTGISLHAGKRFTDQRPRVLYEWDVALNPVHRWQFRGRVRRRDQVCEPRFASFWLDTPSERRIIERENRKSHQLGAHMGAARQEPLGWLSPEGEAIVTEWATDQAPAARRLGVGFPFEGEPMGRVERALARSLMLTEIERAGLIQRLTRGLDLAQQRGWRRRQDPVTLPSREVRRMFWWGNHQSPSDDGGARLRVRRVDAVERCWDPVPGPNLAQVKAAFQQARTHTKNQGPAVLEQWKASWAQETRMGVAASYGRRQAWAWAAHHLPRLMPGQAIQITSPDTRAPVRAMVLNLDAPTGTATRGEASPWALSQVALQVWMVGDAQPFSLSLLALSEDSAFRIFDRAAPIVWFEEPPSPRLGVVMEGNVLAATDWGRRWNQGRPAMILDHLTGEQVVWALPTQYRLEDLAKLPRDMIDTEHALAFFREHRTGSLQATVTEPQKVWIEAASGRLFMYLNEAAYTAASNTWLDDYAVNRYLAGRPRAVEAGSSIMAVPISWSEAGRALGALENWGLGWRVAPEHLAWYVRTSAERLKAPFVSKKGKASTKGKKAISKPKGKKRS